MAKNELTEDERTKWRALYRAGWRTKCTSDKGWWWVEDEKGRRRSHGHSGRWLAVAEVVNA